MLMNPTLTSNFHPAYAPMRSEGIRHDLNRLFYSPDYLRSELIDPQFSSIAYPMVGEAAMAPWGLYGGYPQAGFGYQPGYFAYPGASRSFVPYSYPRPAFDARAFGGYDPRAFEIRPLDARAYASIDPRAYGAYDPRAIDPRALDPRAFDARQFDGAMRPTEQGFAGTNWDANCCPLMNVAETPDAYLLVVELPGVDLKDINLQLHGASLVLSAFRRPTWSNGTVTVNYHQAEGRFGTLRRAVPLPVGVIPGQIQANFVNGTLSIVLPKGAAANGTMPQANIVINSTVPTSM